MTAPYVVVYVDFESRRPRVFKCCEHEGDQHRLEDWLGSQPDLAELVTKALELQRQEPAA